jgi:endonuclease G
MKYLKSYLIFSFFISLFVLASNLVNAQTAVKLVLGNPSIAVTNINTPDNYLVIHNGFVLSYNKARGGANWVTWHLSASDISTAERTNAFAPDTTLPRDWWIKPTDLVLKGYDRGHLCPSEERTDTEANNRETFLMSNMIPQTIRLNRGSWKSLESYIQKTIPRTNSEAYIYAGCYGDKGRIKDKITIPTQCYKIAVILPEGNNDLRRITKDTRVIAVDMPNESDNKSGWKNYITTVDEIESKTGYDFLSTLPDSIQSIIESKKDNQ